MTKYPQRSYEQMDFNVEKISDPRTKKITRVQILSEHATMSFLFTGLYYKLYQRRLRVEHSLGDGLFFIDNRGVKITPEQIEQLNTEFKKIVTDSKPIVLDNMPRSELMEHFRKLGDKDKVGVLKAWQDTMIPVIKYDDFIDYVLEPMSTDKSRMTDFEIRYYMKGVLLRMTTLLNPTSIKEWKDPKVLHMMFHEYTEWGKLLNVDSVAKLNKAVYNGKIKKIKLVAEGLHERKFAKLAEALCANFPQRRVVTCAGPSSSNKTTFAHRLEIQLNVNGYEATVIEMDDYFQDTCKIPVGPDGLQDLEHISAMNVPLLAERVHTLLEGKPIPRRKFYFKEGKGVDDEKHQLILKPNSFLILEGIHGLNPELLNQLGQDQVTPVYVSALTPLNIDYNHRFPTSDLRLIRRIIRDHYTRGKTPRETIRRWTSVRLGEERNIFPYQANAQLFFNSSIVYELPVLAVYGRPLLSEATEPAPDEDPNSPETKDVTDEAERLLGLLKVFYECPSEIVPRNSTIREFIGGSELET